MRCDVVVIGAGAAGLMAAIRAAERSRRTLLLEKNRKPGVKILMSGGTRCNITQNTDRRGIVRAFGSQGPFLHSALSALSPSELVEFFEAEGVATKIEETGKVFPVSNRATDVLAALLRRLRRTECELALDEAVTEVRRDEQGFQVVTSKRTVVADKVILTTGGKSYPGCGTTGDGYAWAAALGHSIVTPRPALTPITSNAAWVADLRGVTIPDVDVRVVENTGSLQKPLAQRRGSFLFTHFGLSGPSVLDVSRAVTGHELPQSLRLVCDFLPAVRLHELDERLKQACAAEGKRQVAGVVALWLPRRLAEAVLEQADVPPDHRAAEISRNQRQRLAESVKQLVVPVSGARGFKKAEVTAGGVSLNEVDSSTMQSKLVPGFYLAGEVLDLDGPIGGYNFQAAFSTAWLAGEDV